MKRKHAWLLAVLTLCTTMAYAQGDEPELNTIDTASVVGFVVKDGFFLSGDFGVFSAFGSFQKRDYSVNPLVIRSKSMSEVNTMVSITTGYDFSRNIGIGLKLANASVAGVSLDGSNSETPESFGLYLVDLNVMGAVSVTGRLRLTANLFGGLTVMVPELAPGSSPLGANGGLSIGLLYDTLLADMVIGLNIAGHGFFTFSSPATATATYWGASITPVVRYVF